MCSSDLGVWPMAEFGGSVLASHRQLRLGARLFDHAILRARNRGVDMLLIHALSENARMLRIVRQAGGLVQRRGPEADALVVLPPVTLASRLEAWLVEQVARMDYRLKRRARSVAAAAA